MRSRWVVALAACVALSTGCSPATGCTAGTDDKPEHLEDLAGIGDIDDAYLDG